MASPSPQRILPLSAEAISQIHSSKHITSLQGVVFSLLENSLDAGATKINIEVDWRRGCCSVDDNGTGIPSSEFSTNGGLARMHCTSKRSPVGTAAGQAPETHGSIGMFIAELAAMSLLTITSTHNRSEAPASITLHQGKVLNRRIPNGPALGASTYPGTCVVVKDLFGNMPVRLKQRTLASEDSKDIEISWQQLRRGVVGLLQAWTNPCVVRLRDVNVESRNVTISGQNHSVSSLLTEKSLHKLAGKSSASKYDLRDALPMLFQSGLAPNESRNRWIPLSASSGAISLKGLICLDPVPTRQCQFVSLGIRPCNPMSGYSELHDAVNMTFANSSFGAVEDGSTDRDSAKTRADGNMAKAQVPRGIDRYPMFCLQINIMNRRNSQAFELDQMSEASLKAITDVLTAAVHAWLEKNHFRPRKHRRRRNEQHYTGDDSSAPPSRPGSGQSGSVPNTPSKFRATDKSRKTPVETLTTQEDGIKRRKVIDLSMRPASSHSTAEAQAQIPLSLDHSTLSNIRKGRDRPKAHMEHRLRTHDKAREGGDDFPGAKSEHFSLRSRFNKGTIEVHSLSGHSTTYLADTLAAQGIQAARVEEKKGLTLSSDDFGNIDDAEMIAVAEGNRENAGPVCEEADDGDNEGNDATFAWTDPASQQVFRVNSRTGIVLPMSAKDTTNEENGAHGPQRERAGIDMALSSAGKPLSLARRKALATEEGERPESGNGEEWLPGFLREWNNPVFARQEEEPIPTASFHGPGLIEFDDNGRPCAHDADGRHALDRSALQNAATKLSKAALKQAEVIGQVDRKFILCRLPTVENSTLVLVDQHAASERVILEDLLSLLLDTTTNTISTINLETETTKAKPLLFEASQQEHELFRRYQSHLALWGIMYTLPSPGTVIKITHLPTLIATRCSALPSLAMDLLRSEVWALADGSKKSLSRFPNPAGGWVSLVPLVPSKLLDMLHSRACRSAIMFNDALTKEECNELMGKVAKCVFPFVCAHGRVGMVPVMEIGGNQPGESAFGGVDNQREQTCKPGDLAKWMTQTQ